ncbi:hypothetical protein BLA60_38945 [Actinophytocola xinjiangensis]|uniref:FAD-binding domain-containing protein n=1 Tax=Actinophytocola xinjiangensis TaxID=485602 RepID=A0A7Z0WE32_9PSEU|nr:FAD-dependent monooxygenase [Actinophytocola xinjiangensis]OLF04828.1 hypothetical protein BLA60_38945 [Actinophytocola xinjiangensis]
MFDVIVVGGGPVGLFLACELRLAGARPLVLERRPEPDPADKAHGLAGQVVRLFDHRGLVERCGGRGAPQPAPGFFFGGLPLPLHTLGEDNPMYLLPVPQRALEGVLAARAAELGVEVRRGTDVRSFVQHDDRVEVSTVDGTEAARYLVGCDGAASLVRKSAGIGFPGVTEDDVVERWALVGASDAVRFGPMGRVEIDGLGEIPAHFHRTDRGVFTILAHDPARPLVNTVEWTPDPGGPPLTLAEMEHSVERVLGVRVPLTPPPEGAPTLLRRTAGRNTRLAERYRDRRVFLAGDAAHVGNGPTLNLGLQDAANLAWKLGATVRGHAPDGLLDTYESERRPCGERVSMATQADRTALLAPGPAVTALRQLFGELLTDRENVRRLAALMAGADIRYDMGEDPGPLAGAFAPSLDLTVEGAARRLPELLREAQPVLVDLTGTDALADTVAPLAGRVRHARAGADGRTDALLVRPDGYVAWSGTDPDGLTAALVRWFTPAR